MRKQNGWFIQSSEKRRARVGTSDGRCEWDLRYMHDTRKEAALARGHAMQNAFSPSEVFGTGPGSCQLGYACCSCTLALVPGPCIKRLQLGMRPAACCMPTTVYQECRTLPLRGD